MSTEWLHRAGHSGESALLTSPYARLSSPAESPAKSGEHDKSMPLGTISHNAQQSSIDYAHNPESKTETIKSKLGSLLRYAYLLNVTSVRLLRLTQATDVSLPRVLHPLILRMSLTRLLSSA
jgi:hypothetical protein